MKTLFFLFLHIFTFFSSNVYIDPNSLSGTEDGSLANPFKTFTSAVASISAPSVLLIKSGSILTDIAGTLVITNTLNITASTTDTALATISLSQNAMILVHSPVILQNIAFSRTPNQTIPQSFFVNYSSITLQNCQINNILSDGTLNNLFQVVMGSLTFSNMKFSTFSTNISSIISSAYSTITFSNISFTNCQFNGSFLSTINSNVTISGLQVANSVFLNVSMFFVGFDGVLFPSNFYFVSLTLNNLTQAVSKVGGLFLNSAPQNFTYTSFFFTSAQFSQIASLNNIIHVEMSLGEMMFTSCYFSNNNGESLLFTNQISVLVFTDVRCLSNNLLGFMGVNQSCFNLRTTVVRLFNYLLIDSCQGMNSAGLKFYDNDTMIASMASLANLTGFMNFTECNFTNNYISFVNNGDVEIGTAIYVSSSNYMNFTNCLFLNNTMNTSETLFKNGGPCINSIDLSQTIQVFSTSFIGNVARYYSNCIMFVGTLIDFESSVFQGNVPILSSDDLNNRENLGGALYILAETTMIRYCTFRDNLNYNGGAMYINGNKNRAVSNLLHFSNQWINNTAITYGGVIFFDYDFIILNANLTLDLYQHNWAQESGGAIFTQYSSDSANILLYKCSLIENLSGLGGALALTHLIGLLATDTCNFLRNAGSYMSMTDFLAGKQPDSSDRGAGGALRIEGRIFTLYVSQKCNYIGNWAALRGGVLAGLPGNSTFLLDVFQGNHAQMAGTFYVGTFHFLYFVYSQIMGDYAEQTGSSMVIKEFCLCYVQNGYFQDCHAPQAQGVIVLSDEITTYVLSTTFVNVSSQEGSVLYVTDIKSSPFVVQNMVVLNSYSFYAQISIYDSSNLLFVTSNFTNNTGRIFSCQNCIMAIIGNIILNNFCMFQNEIQACFLYASDGSQLQVNLTMCSNISNIKEGGSVYAIDSTIMFYSYMLIATVSQTYGGCIVGSSSNIIVLSSLFLNYMSGCFYLESSNLTVVSSNFSNPVFQNQSMLYGSTIACENCENSMIIGCLFSGNYNNSLQGGALYFDNDIYVVANSLVVQNCVFLDNYVSQMGGAIYLTYQIGIITGNSFVNNRATTGGAIYYEETLTSTTRAITIVSNNFTQNAAVVEGGAIKYISKRPLSVLLNNYLGNTATYGDNIASYPVRIRLFINGTLFPYDTYFILPNEVSNSDISVPLTFGLFDADNQECILINTGQATISASENSTINTTNATNSSDDVLEISGTLNQFITDGEFTFDQILMKSFPPNKTFYLTILTDSTTVYYPDFLLNVTLNEQNINGQYAFVVPVYLRSCVIGEIYETIYEGCYQCEYSKFSLNISDEICSPCPDNAICYGGRNISLYPGYWRSSIWSLNIVQCTPYADSCLGQYESQCLPGYVGPLCQTCDVFGPVIYRKSGLFQCSQCGNEDINILLLVLASGGIFVFYIILIKSNVSKLKSITIDKTTNKLTTKSKRDMHLSIIFRIFLNYLQIVSLAQDFDLTWPDVIQNMFAIQYNLGNISEYMFSFDCFVKTESTAIPTIYLRAILTGLTPAIAFFFILLFWIFYKIWTRKPIKNDLITTLLISTYFIQPTVINMMAKIVSCKEVDPGKYYITTYLYFQCYTDEHNKYMYYLAIPLLVLWVGLYPFCIFTYLFRNRHRLESLELRKKLGFIYNGYNSNVYFWEFIVMLRKIIIILVAAFLKYNAFARALVVLFVLGISIYLQTLKKPFFSENLNELEYRAIIVSLFTIYFGLFYYVTPDDYGKFLTIIVIIVSNIYFLSYWFLQLMAVQYESFLKLLRCCPKLQAIVVRIKEKIDKLEQILNTRRSSIGMNTMDKVKLTSQISSAKHDFGSNSMDQSNHDTAKVFPKKL